MNKNIYNKLKALKICVIGLGYVGLPLAVEFAKVRAVIGFDIDSIRINELQQGFDRTFEVRPTDLKNSEKLSFTADVKQIKLANCYIVTVPTPIDVVNRPDLRPLYAACEIVSSVLGKDDIVIFESTVFPGATEEELIPLIEKQSKLKCIGCGNEVSISNDIPRFEQDDYVENFGFEWSIHQNTQIDNDYRKESKKHFELRFDGHLNNMGQNI